MQITVKKEAQETIEVTIPAYFKNYGFFYKVGEDYLMKASPLLLVSYRTKEHCFDEEVAKCIKFEPSTEEEFTAAYNEAIDTFNKMAFELV